MRSQVAQTSLHPRQVQHKSACAPKAVWCRHNFPACCSHEVAQVQLLQVEHQDQRSGQRWASRGTALPRALPRAFSVMC